MNNDSDGENPGALPGWGWRGAHTVYIYTCFQLGIAFSLQRSFFPYGVDLSEACQLSRELALIGLKKTQTGFRTCKS